MADEQQQHNKRKWAGRLLKILGVLLVVVLAAGFLLGWFSLSVQDADTATDDRFSIVFTVNKDHIWSSAEEAKKEAVGFKDQLGEAAKLHSANGVVKEIDSANRRLTIAPNANESESMIVQLDDESRIVRNDVELQLTDLQPGDEVSVTYREEDDVKRARKITRL